MFSFSNFWEFDALTPPPIESETRESELQGANIQKNFRGCMSPGSPRSLLSRPLVQEIGQYLSQIRAWTCKIYKIYLKLFLLKQKKYIMTVSSLLLDTQSESFALKIMAITWRLQVYFLKSTLNQQLWSSRRGGLERMYRKRNIHRNQKKL